jgi:hypothetical protein
MTGKLLKVISETKLAKKKPPDLPAVWGGFGTFWVWVRSDLSTASSA